tara:strand:+ start:390 stop:1028 length:639 start_codon:yes stop_codon:yes gene_type:complete
MDQDTQQQTPPATPPTPPAQADPTPVAPPTAPTTEDPGKTLGIIGLVFAFVGLQLIGLILSIIGHSKSKKAGHKNTVALVGIIINAIFVAIAVIMIPLFILISLASYQGINERASTTAANAAAASVAKEAELFGITTGEYPLTSNDIAEEVPEVTFTSTPLVAAPEDPATVEFQACSDDGNKIGYWDYEYSVVRYLYTGNSSTASTCLLLAY